MNSAVEAALPIIHLLGSGGFYGAERMLLDHCLATAGRHQVLFLGAPAPLVARFRAAGVQCHDCPDLSTLLRSLHRQRAQRPLLNAHNFKGLVFGWLAALLWRLPLVITQHGFTPRSRKQRLYTWLSLQLCRTRVVDRVVCVAESIAVLHRQAQVRADKLHVIPNGLPAALAALPSSPGEHPWLAGFVGRLSQEKGPDLFLDALIPLCRQHPTLNAVMLGDGPEREALQARIDAAGLAGRIHLPGYQHDMQPWWARLHALVISSRTEGTPMILLEAMQAGVPVVAFAVGGIGDVIVDGHNGLLAPALDSPALARQLTCLLEQPQRAGQLRDNARHTQRERYDLAALAGRWGQLYLNTARGARP